MELEQLRQIEAIERLGTISAAAEELHLTQPSLSRSVRRLEADLGQELFSRTRNRVELNDAGRLAVRHAREVLAAEQRMRDAFDELARRQRTLRVGSVAPAPTWNLTARIIEHAPGTILSTEILPEPELDRRLFEGTVDLGVTLRPLAAPNVVSVPLMTESLSVCVPKDHALAGRDSVSFADIDGEAFLVFEQIGFWMGVTREMLPASQLIVQRDREVFLQLASSSNLLFFTTDVPQNSGVASLEGRCVIPIRDVSAHATFYVVALVTAPSLALDLVTWIRQTRS